MSTPSPAIATSPATQRLQSIDALRGFDMFWIIRGDAIFRSLAVFLGYPALEEQLHHVSWDGFRFYDLIFPLFLFIVGVVLPFSLSKYIEQPQTASDRWAAHRKAFLRACLLVFLGWVYSGFLQFNFDDFRWPGVLQRIGICYFFGAIAVLNLRVRGQVILLAGLLVGYWVLLRTVPAPGFKAYDLTMEGSLVGYIDRLLIPGKLHYKLGDNEGVLSTLPAIGNVLMGALAGQWLRSTRTSGIKVLGLFLASAVSLTAGYLWSYEFPLNKILWTSSFVLVTGGCSLALLGIFYGLIDVLGYRRWAFFFTVIGMNAITIYVAQRFIDFTKISQFFLGGVAQHLGTALQASHSPTEVEAAQKFVLAVGVIAAEWLFLWHLYRHKIFLKV